MKSADNLFDKHRLQANSQSATLGLANANPQEPSCSLFRLSRPFSLLSGCYETEILRNSNPQIRPACFNVGHQVSSSIQEARLKVLEI